jgi:oligoendopeptidase F
LTLARYVLAEGEPARRKYFAFLKSGGSRFPLESLRMAGVDMSQTGPVESALELFGDLLAEMEAFFA